MKPQAEQNDTTSLWMAFGNQGPEPALDRSLLSAKRASVLDLAIESGDN